MIKMESNGTEKQRRVDGMEEKKESLGKTENPDIVFFVGTENRIRDRWMRSKKTVTHHSSGSYKVTYVLLLN